MTASILSPRDSVGSLVTAPVIIIKVGGRSRHTPARGILALSTPFARQRGPGTVKVGMVRRMRLGIIDKSGLGSKRAEARFVTREALRLQLLVGNLELLSNHLKFLLLLGNSIIQHLADRMKALAFSLGLEVANALFLTSTLTILVHVLLGFELIQQGFLLLIEDSPLGELVAKSCNRANIFLRGRQLGRNLSESRGELVNILRRLDEKLKNVLNIIFDRSELVLDGNNFLIIVLGARLV